MRNGVTSWGTPYKYQPQKAKMELRKILPDLVKEAGREVFLKENGGTKNGFYVKNLDTAIGKLKT
ncbi:hypothetical protein [Desulfurobacterium indicum]|uniref:hypothetical protein n=1 Tax=Desulfurobacterium indicum TaxID=1914305 RepID=UPI0011982476|nr:hypothetical protein [Desulfurobacterium indicum]